MNKNALHLKLAKDSQVNEISHLVNLAYRGEKGWTKETALVRGSRCTTDEILGYLSNPHAHLLVASIHKKIMACICIEQKEDCAYIGFFAVHPKIQGQGIGHEMLSQAENFASKNLNLQKYVMVVVSQRIELIAYYERRGYRKTGRVEPYPSHLKVGEPLKNDLTIESLEKRV